MLKEKTFLMRNYVHNSIFLIVSVLILIVNAYFIYRGFYDPWLGMEDEDGLLESVQAICLFISFVILLVCARLTQPKNIIIYLCGALFCFSFILREIDFDHTNLPDIIVYLGSGIGKRVMLSIFWLALVVYFCKNFIENIKTCMKFSVTTPGLIYIVSGFLLVCGALFDKSIINVENRVLFEELFETMGYSVVVIASLACLLILDLLRRDASENVNSCVI